MQALAQYFPPLAPVGAPAGSAPGVSQQGSSGRGSGGSGGSSQNTRSGGSSSSRAGAAAAGRIRVTGTGAWAEAGTPWMQASMRPAESSRGPGSVLALLGSQGAPAAGSSPGADLVSVAFTPATAAAVGWQRHPFLKPCCSTPLQDTALSESAYCVSCMPGAPWPGSGHAWPRAAKLVFAGMTGRCSASHCSPSIV